MANVDKSEYLQVAFRVYKKHDPELFHALSGLGVKRVNRLAFLLMEERMLGPYGASRCSTDAPSSGAALEEPSPGIKPATSIAPSANVVKPVIASVTDADTKPGPRGMSAEQRRRWLATAYNVA